MNAVVAPVVGALGADRALKVRILDPRIGTEFPLPANARGVGLTAGSDRQPVGRLANRLWYADGTGNKISYLHFE